MIEQGLLLFAQLQIKKRDIRLKLKYRQMEYLLMVLATP